MFIDSIIEDTGLSRTGISVLYLASTVLSAILVSFVSRLADRYGPRIMLVAAGLGLGAACFGMATATHILLFYIAFASLRALGQGSLGINCILLVNQWFVSLRGRAVGLMTLGAMLSTALFPSFARFLIDSIDWRGAYAVLGVVSIGLIVPVALLVVRNRPEDVGLFPDGSSQPPVSETRQATAGVQRRARVYSSPGFWLLSLSLSSPSLITTALMFHQASIFRENELSATLAAGAFAIFSVSSAVSSLASGVRVGPHRSQDSPIFLDGDPGGDPGAGCGNQLAVRGRDLCSDDGSLQRVLHHRPRHHLGLLLWPSWIGPCAGARHDHLCLCLGGWAFTPRGISTT